MLWEKYLWYIRKRNKENGCVYICTMYIVACGIGCTRTQTYTVTHKYFICYIENLLKCILFLYQCLLVYIYINVSPLLYAPHLLLYMYIKLPTNMHYVGWPEMGKV